LFFDSLKLEFCSLRSNKNPFSLFSIIMDNFFLRIIIEQKPPKMTDPDTIKKRCVINFLSNKGWSISEIMKNVECSKKQVVKWKDGPFEEFDYSRKPGSGRKRKLDEDEEKKLETILEVNNLEGSMALQEEIEEEVKQPLSDRSIRRYSSRFGFVWGKPNPRAVLTEEIRQSRLKWCLLHVDQDWKIFIFSDEKLFRCGLAPVGIRYRKGEKPNFQKFRGKTFHIWNAIHYDVKFPILQVPDGMNSEKYVVLLNTALESRYEEGMIFQQDNAPSHSCENTWNWLDDNDYDFEDFPPCSPDLNPIENMWGVVNREVRKKNPKTLSELRQVVIEEMGKVTRKQVKKLILSMTNRVNQCIERNGGYTDY
jgi:transposase